MDPNAIAGMVFTLLLAGMMGGFILLYPLSKKLAALLEAKLQTPEQRTLPSDKEITQLRDQVARLEQQLKRVVDRQEFTEQLIGERQSNAISAPK